MRLAIFAAVVSQVGAQSNQDQFAAFKEQFGRHYIDETEEGYRFGVFKDNLRRIDEDNANPEDGAEYGVTRWADRTYQENRLRCGGTCVGPNCTRITPRRGVKGKSHAWDGTCYAKVRFPAMCNSTLSKEMDWTTKGAVTGVKDQGECGNCFTFGATCDMEAAWFLAGNALVSLSEQQLTSCDKVGGDGGCDGADTNLDTDEYVTTHGLTSEKNYPYSTATKNKQMNGKCNTQLEAKPVAKFTSGYQISGGAGDCDWCDKQPVDENKMMKHLATAGPFTIAINSKFFDNYEKGIMNPPKFTCPGFMMSLDHQVAIVGYGTENGKDYWKIRNSWGPKWGENGYCRIARGTNKCGVASDASHVVAAVKEPDTSEETVVV